MKSQISSARKAKLLHQEWTLMQEVARHAQDGQRDGEGGADLDEARLAVDLGLAGGCFGVGGRVEGGCVDDAIAGALDGGDQVAAARHAGQVAHARFFAGEVDRCAEDAVVAIERAGDVFLAHGAGHAGDGQVDARRGDAVAGMLHRATRSLVFRGAVIVLHLGLFGRQVDADIGDAVGAVEAALDILDAHGAGHAGDRQGDFFGRHDSGSFNC